MWVKDEEFKRFTKHTSAIQKCNTTLNFSSMEHRELLSHVAGGNNIILIK